MLPAGLAGSSRRGSNPGNRNRTAEDAKHTQNIPVRTQHCVSVSWWQAPLSVIGPTSQLDNRRAGEDRRGETACCPARSVTSGDPMRLKSVEVRGQTWAVSRKPSAVIIVSTESAIGLRLTANRSGVFLMPYPTVAVSCKLSAVSPPCRALTSLRNMGSVPRRSCVPYR